MIYPQILHLMVKKIFKAVDNLTESEKKRRQLIIQIQEYKREGCSIPEMLRRTGKDRKTVVKYIEGDPDILCRSSKSGIMDSYKDFIIKCLSDGMTQSETCRQLKQKGYTCTGSNARYYMCHLIREYNINVKKYCSEVNTVAIGNNPVSKGAVYDYITRKGLFQYLWMDGELTEHHRNYIFNKYPVLYIINKCIREFRAIFDRKNMPLLYLFIDDYKNSEVKELAAFASGLEKDIDAVENAVASNLSNGFVEGTNSKVKMVKRTMYGRCGLKLLSAKLMYNPAS